MSDKKIKIKPDLFVSDISNERYEEYHSKKKISVDCEMMGLNPRRDRLCVVQICDENLTTSLVQILPNQVEALNIKKLFENLNIIKIFHFARMDTLFLKYRLNTIVNNIYCTKIASKLARTYTDKHGLKEIAKEFFDEALDKKKQSSDWGQLHLDKEQIEYASNDVRFLIPMEEKLTEILIREGRMDIALECFKVLPLWNQLDWIECKDIFEH